jgi:hypothetical protein
MDIDWRTVQMFLSEEGIAEVEIDTDNSSKVRCSCPSFQKNARCKHQRKVRATIAENFGHYTVLVPEDVPEEVALTAMSDPQKMREFIIRYGRVEVL